MTLVQREFLSNLRFYELLIQRTPLLLPVWGSLRMEIVRFQILLGPLYFFPSLWGSSLKGWRLSAFRFS
jgi:hypothetical protein